MVNTRRASFRLGEETERKLEELAGLAESTRTEMVRELISARHAELHPVKKSKSVNSDPAQMLLEEILSHEVDEDRWYDF